MRQSFFDYCRLYQKQNLLDEWDAERNLPLTPQTVTYGSHKSAWWRCENGHEWKAAIYTRSDGARCPYCTGRKLWSIREPTAADVRSAPEKRHKQASTIWQRSIRSWRGSGIIRRIFLYYRQMLQPAAIG